MGAVTPGETLGPLYNIHVGSNKTKLHAPRPRRSELMPIEAKCCVPRPAGCEAERASAAVEGFRRVLPLEPPRRKV